VIRNYLEKAFGRLTLCELTAATLQHYFSGMADWKLSHESIDKIRDVLSAILQSAVKYQVLIKNPMEQVSPPRRKQGKRSKPYLTPQQFETLIRNIPEPYASMVFVAIYTVLRASELIGLRWRNVHENALTVEERCCRGDWGVPKSEASVATIAVNRCLIERIRHLKLLTVEVRAGRATRKYKVVKSDGPDDLFFQGVKDGQPIHDNNVLSRFLKAAGRKCGLPFVNWRCLRTSHATWLKLGGADVKDAQAQMHHSRASTTLDLYQQFATERQLEVVGRLRTLMLQWRS
jgi:integrase